MAKPVHTNVAMLERIAITVEEALDDAAPFLEALTRYSKAAAELHDAEQGLEFLGMRSLYTGRAPFVFTIDAGDLCPHFACWSCGQPIADNGLVLIETDEDGHYTGRVIAVHRGRCDNLASGQHRHPWRDAQRFVRELIVNTGVTSAELLALASALEKEGKALRCS